MPKVSDVSRIRCCAVSSKLTNDEYGNMEKAMELQPGAPLRAEYIRRAINNQVGLDLAANE